MLKVHKVKQLCHENNGEYVLGLKDLNTHACYLIYGELKPGEKERKACPGDGHEEILVAVSGKIRIVGDKIDLTLMEGEAVHMREEETYMLENNGDITAVYIMAGGHSEEGHK